ncbi:hypothetical protein GCM10007874_15750 [Labrys miyagiensis]|uniref:Uncharacterized protein n=1 Tax=Labrys miyagiensis TaxID=346912 RepID=A0ABQ6CDW7_9HYPH|nr:hypothetical protein [Labrys miyagiensis]GLS18558.1 hypothetical protein GCM10007874_15750 [Labrys miyagiensis]
MEKDVILLDGFGITASDLVPPGTVATILHGGDVKVFAAEDLRATVERLGSNKSFGMPASWKVSGKFESGPWLGQR